MTSIRLWQWLLITAIVCGLGYWHANTPNPDDLLGDYQSFPTDQMVSMSFSKTLTQEYDFIPHTVILVLDPKDDPAKQIVSISRNGAVAKVQVGDHYYKKGQKITFSECGAAEYNGVFTVEEVINQNYFTIKVPETAPASPKCENAVSTTTVRLVYMVKGFKVSREKTAIKDNVAVHEQREYYCLVDFSQFKPRLPSLTIEQKKYTPTAMQRFFEFIKLKPKDPDDSVLNFLATVQNKQGTRFKYVWWKLPNIQKVIWVGVPFILFGVFFPILNNILTYGKIFAPPREKGLSLRKVKSTPEPGAQPKPSVTAEDIQAVQEMADAMEEKLGEDVVSDKPYVAPDEAVQEEKDVRKLSDAPSEKLKTIGNQDDNEFGRDSGDFYPTVLGHETKYKPMGQGENPESEKKE
jgi:hypothetical protein